MTARSYEISPESTVNCHLEYEDGGRVFYVQTYVITQTRRVEIDPRNAARACKRLHLPQAQPIIPRAGLLFEDPDSNSSLRERRDQQMVEVAVPPPKISQNPFKRGRRTWENSSRSRTPVQWLLGTVSAWVGTDAPPVAIAAPATVPAPEPVQAPTPAPAPALVVAEEDYVTTATAPVPSQYR